MSALGNAGSRCPTWVGEAWTLRPMGSLACTVMATWAELEPEVARRRTADRVAERRAAGKDLSGRLQRC